MRTFVSALLALLALVVAACGLASAWVDENLVQQSGFVSLAAPLAEDADFQSALSDALVQEVTGSTGLPEQLESFVEPLIRDAAGAVTGAAGYPAAWTQTLRLSHALTFARAPEPAETAPAVLTLDLGPVVQLVTEEVGGSLGIDLPVPGDTTIDIGSIERGGALSGVAGVVGSWKFYLAVAGVLALLAVLAARRRGTTLALLGAGVLVIGVLGLLARQWVPAAASRAPVTSAIADVLLRGIAERAGSDIAVSSMPVLVGGLVVLVLGAGLQLASGRGRRAQPAAEPWA